MAPRVTGWRAYYSDGESYGDFPLPESGIVCVMEYEANEWTPGKPYRRLIEGSDWYWLDGRWESSGTGEWGTWLEKPHPSAIRSTTRLPQADYDGIIASAFALEAI